MYDLLPWASLYESRREIEQRTILYKLQVCTRATFQSKGIVSVCTLYNLLPCTRANLVKNTELLQTSYKLVCAEYSCTYDDPCGRCTFSEILQHSRSTLNVVVIQILPLDSIQAPMCTPFIRYPTGNGSPLLKMHKWTLYISIKR